MRNIKHILLLILFALNYLSCFAQPEISESDPSRGMYVNRFLKYNTLTINSGSYEVDTSNSILGVDVNFDGIFEKEDRLLQYCMDNHITSIVLYDLRNIIGRGIYAWNESTNQYEDLEDHLCRFMEKAREHYCIDEIGAAGQSAGFFGNIGFNYGMPTPPIPFTAQERSSPWFNPILELADSTLNVDDSLFVFSEDLKYWLRLSNLRISDCDERINLFHEEYEFWNVNDLPRNIKVNSTCAFTNCVPCTTGIVGERVYPNIYLAAYHEVFIPALKAMKAVKLFVNAGMTPTDPDYLKSQVYFQLPQIGFDVTQILDLYSFIDGNPAAFFPSASLTACQRDMYDFNNDGNADLDGLPYADRVLSTEFRSYPSPNGVNNDLYDKLAYPGASVLIPDVDHTDIHPLFSAESIANNGYNDYWGPWFDDASENNIFMAEKAFYDEWSATQIAASRPILHQFQNDFHRGGVHWYTSSFLAPKNEIQLNQGSPKIFKTNNPLCADPSLPFSLTIEYLGPTEDGLVVDFWIADCTGNSISGSTCDLSAPCSNVTKPVIPYFDDPTIKILDDFIATIPQLPSGCNFLKANMRVNYPGGCSYTYEEDIQVSSGQTISALGVTEFCEGDQVFLSATSGGPSANYSWFKDNAPIGSTISGEAGRQFRATESGEYNCIIDNTTPDATQCIGSTNTITVTVHPNPRVAITADCNDDLDEFTLYADYSFGTAASPTGVGGVTYLWSTGETTNQINIDIDPSSSEYDMFNDMTYYVTATTPYGCQRTDSDKFSDDELAFQNILASVPNPPNTNPCAIDQTVNLTYYGAHPIHVELFDGNRFTSIPWLTGPSYSINNLSPGEYTVFATESFGGCVSSATFVIGPAIADPPVISYTSINNICSNDQDGSITITSITGATSAIFNIEIYALNVNQPFIPNVTFSDLPSGTYVVKVSDQVCNESCTTITITTLDSPIEFEFVTVPVSCHGGTDGEGTINVLSGGTAPFSYLWQNGNTTNSIVNQSAGSYSVVISDAQGCSVNTMVVIGQQPELSYTILQNAYSCSTGQATVVISVEGGTPYENGTDLYHGFPSGWDQSVTINNQYHSETNSSAQTFTIHDDNNCELDINISPAVSNNVTVNFFHTDSECNGALGTASVIPGNGISPYTYSWSNSLGTSQIVTGLQAGFYTCTVTDASGCSNSGTVEILGNVLNVTLSATPILCFGGTSTITVSATGGTTPYTGIGNFSVAAGTHTYTVTDALGCTGTNSITISEPTQLVASSSMLNVILCNSETGEVTVTATGGTAPYTGTGTFTVNAGNHSYTVTDANGCSSVTNITVTEPSAIVVSGSASQIACSGGSSTVSISATGGTTPYTGTGSFTRTAGTYSFTVTDANGCTATTSVTITEPSPLIATDIQNPIGCTGGYTTVTIGASGGTPPYSGTGAFNVVAGNYSFTVTDSRGCSSTVAPIVVDNVNCCYASGGEIETPISPAVSVILTGSYSGLKSLNYDAYVNSNVTFNGLELIIAAGRSIIIQAGHTLTITNSSNLHACTNLWKGIVVMPGGSLIVNGNSIVSDAENGALLKTTDAPTSTCILENAIFKNNYIGVMMEENPLQNFNAITLEVMSSDFICPDPLKPSSNVAVGSVSYSGLYLNDWIGSVGKAFAYTDGSTFDNLNWGIRSNRCVLSVYYSNFININPDYSYPFNPYYGSGIYATGGNGTYFLNQYGLGKTSAASFSNCTYGIISNGVREMIRDNNMENVVHGVLLMKLPDGSTSWVTNNRIQCIYDGIISQFNEDINFLSIGGNDIELNNTTGENNYGVGIGSYDYLSNRGKQINIVSNLVTVENGQYGIELQGTANHLVYFNEVNCTTSTSNLVAGFSTKNSQENLISCNYVIGNTGTSADPQYGYYFGLSPRNEVSCNKAFDINYGFEFDGDCNMEDLYSGNEMSTNYIGLNFNFNGVVSRQFHRGNKWDIGSFSSGNEAVNSINYTASPFYTNPNDPADITPISPVPQFGWFYPDLSANALECSPSNLCGTKDPKDETFGIFEKMVANNIYDPIDFSEESKWSARYFLFQKISQDTAALSDPELLFFYNSYLNSSIDKLNSVKSETALIDLKSVSDSTLLSNTDSLLKVTIESMENCEMALSNGVITPSQYYVTIASLKQIVAGLTSDSRQIISTLKVQSDLGADNVRLVNSIISTNEQFEQNEKFVNDVYLKSTAKDILSIGASDQSQLLSIAHQCPFLGGSSVYLARNLYRLVNPSEVYDDYSICHAIGMMRKRNPEKSDISDTYVFPNPANKKLTLVYSLTNESKSSLDIFDSSLKLVFSDRLDGMVGEKSLNLELFRPGLYIYNIVQENHVVASGKFSVVH